MSRIRVFRLPGTCMALAIGVLAAAGCTRNGQAAPSAPREGSPVTPPGPGSVVVEVIGYSGLTPGQMQPQDPDWNPYEVKFVGLRGVSPESLAGEEWHPHYCGGGFDIEFAHKVWELGKRYRVPMDALPVIQGGCLPMVTPVELP